MLWLMWGVTAISAAGGFGIVVGATIIFPFILQL